MATIIPPHHHHHLPHLHLSPRAQDMLMTVLVILGALLLIALMAGSFAYGQHLAPTPDMQPQMPGFGGQIPGVMP